MPGKAPADTPGQTDLQYVGIGEDSLQTMLLFDDTAGLGLSNLAGALSGKKSVKACTNQLLNWLTIEDGEPKKQPATLEFAWGTGLTFVGVLVDVTVQFLMFDTKGEPTRATASITMYAKNDRTKGTNPTSGGLPGRTSAQVQEGDTLASISYRQYGDPNLWRAIAASNDIDDPTRVPIGSRLLVPSRRDALAFSAREHLDG
jgi:nucleoid-associated protein YgaU